MPSVWQWTGFVAGGLGCAGCALVTKFDPAKTTDAGSDGDAGAGCPSGALLCEDFENGFDATKWTDIQQLGGTTAIEGTSSHVHSGAHSLHVHTDAAPMDANESYAEWRVTNAPWKQELYVRAFIYWTDPLSAGAANILQLQNADRSAGFVLYAGRTVFGWTAWAPPVDSQTTNTPPLTNAWLCVEWKLFGTDVAVSFDGGGSYSLEDSAAPTFPFAEFDVGLAFGHDSAEPAMDAWIDDVVVDTKPVPCGT